MFGRSFFCIILNAYIKKRSEIQSKFLDGGTSNKVPKTGRAYNSLAKRPKENKGKERGEVRIDDSAE